MEKLNLEKKIENGFQYLVATTEGTYVGSALYELNGKGLSILAYHLDANYEDYEGEFLASIEKYARDNHCQMVTIMGYSDDLEDYEEYHYTKGASLKLDEQTVQMIFKKEIIPVPLYPVPNFLKKNFYITGTPTETEVSGNIKCACGEDAFEMTFYSDKKTGERKLIELICPKCGVQIIPYDASMSSWGGLILHQNYGFQGRQVMTRPTCKDCKKNQFKVSMSFTSYGKDAYKENIPEEEYDETKWADVPTRVVVDLKCANCGREIPKFIDQNFSGK